MAPSPISARYTNSESVFKPDIFKGKALFCTGGGSGICKEMTYAMIKHGANALLSEVGALSSASRSMHHLMYGVLTGKDKNERDPPFRHHQPRP